MRAQFKTFHGVQPLLYGVVEEVDFQVNNLLRSLAKPEHLVQITTQTILDPDSNWHYIVTVVYHEEEPPRSHISQ